MYRDGHATDALLGAFAFDDVDSVSVFVNAHEGNPDDVNRSVEHEIAHRSLALDSDTGAVQLALAWAMADRPEESRWATWLAASIESSWATYEGFALERESWIATVHGFELPRTSQPRYRDAASQYRQIHASLPEELLPWRFLLARAVADFSLNFSLAGVAAQDLLNQEQMRALLGDLRRRADARLAKLSTTIERIGFDRETADRLRAEIARTFEKTGSYASDPLHALVGAYVLAGDEPRRHMDELDAAMMPVFFDYFQRICPTLSFDPSGAHRVRFLDEARTDLRIPLPRIIRSSEAHWPALADIHSILYVHEGRFQPETAFREGDATDELLQRLADDPAVVAYAVWTNGSTICLVPFVTGHNLSADYDPLRAPATARMRGDVGDQVMRLSGERLYVLDATTRTLTFLGHKVLGALYTDNESRDLVSGAGWLSGQVLHRIRYSNLVRVLRGMRAHGVVELRIVLKTPEVVYLALVEATGEPVLVELPTALIGLIRVHDPPLFNWYSTSSMDATRLNDDLSAWGYLMASCVVAGALERTLSQSG